MDELLNKLGYQIKNTNDTNSYEKNTIEISLNQLDDIKFQYCFSVLGTIIKKGVTTKKQLPQLIHQVEKHTHLNLNYLDKLHKLLTADVIGYSLISLSSSDGSKYIKTFQNFQFNLTITDLNINYVIITMCVHIISESGVSNRVNSHEIMKQTRKKSKTPPETLFKIIEGQERFWDVRNFELITLETYLVAQKFGFTICECWWQHNQNFHFDRNYYHCGTFTRSDKIVDIDTTWDNDLFIIKVYEQTLDYGLIRILTENNFNNFNQSLQKLFAIFASDPKDQK